MKIAEITPYRGKLFAVVFEEGKTLWLHADILVEACLSVGDELEPARILELRQASIEHRTYEYALYLLEKRAYSYRGLYEKLMQAKQAQEAAVHKALARLLRVGLLNDTQYAESLARIYIESKHYGSRRAAFEMRQRGLAQAEIDAALAKYDATDETQARLADLLTRKYARALSDASDRRAVERVKASLARRGFSFSEIRTAMDNWFDEQAADAATDD